MISFFLYLYSTWVKLWRVQIIMQFQWYKICVWRIQNKTHKSNIQSIFYFSYMKLSFLSKNMLFIRNLYYQTGFIRKHYLPSNDFKNCAILAMHIIYPTTLGNVTTHVKISSKVSSEFENHLQITISGFA